MKRRAFLTGLLTVPFAALGAKAAHGATVPAIMRLYPHQRHAILGMMYGMGSRRIAETYGITEREAEDMLSDFRRTQAGLRVWAMQNSRSIGRYK